MQGAKRRGDCLDPAPFGSVLQRLARVAQGVAADRPAASLEPVRELPQPADVGGGERFIRLGEERRDSLEELGPDEPLEI